MYTEAAFLCWGHQGLLFQGSECLRSAILWDEKTGNWASEKRGKFSRALVLQHMVQHMVCMSPCGNLSNRYPQRPPPAAEPYTQMWSSAAALGQMTYGPEWLCRPLRSGWTQKHHGPWAPTWPHEEVQTISSFSTQIATGATNLNTDSAIDEQMAPTILWAPSINMVLGVNTDHPDLYGPGNSMTLRHLYNQVLPPTLGIFIAFGGKQSLGHQSLSSLQ